MVQSGYLVYKAHKPFRWSSIDIGRSHFLWFYQHTNQQKTETKQNKAMSIMCNSQLTKFLANLMTTKRDKLLVLRLTSQGGMGAWEYKWTNGGSQGRPWKLMSNLIPSIHWCKIDMLFVCCFTIVQGLNDKSGFFVCSVTCLQQKVFQQTAQTPLNNAKVTIYVEENNFGPDTLPFHVHYRHYHMVQGRDDKERHNILDNIPVPVTEKTQSFFHCLRPSNTGIK